MIEWVKQFLREEIKDWTLLELIVALVVSFAAILIIFLLTV